MTFTKILENDLKKSDKRGLATLYLYWLENGKKDCFDLPLFISDDEKGVLSVEVFKRVFYSFMLKAQKTFIADIKSGTDGDESKYNVVRITKKADDTKEKTIANYCELAEPTKSDVKRESSKITNAKAKAKKETKAKEEEALDHEWNKKASMKIVDHLKGKYKLTCDTTTLEKEIINILNSIQ